MPGSFLPLQLGPASRNLPAPLPVVRVRCHQSAARITARRRTEVLGQTGSPQAGVCRLLADGEASRQMPLQTNCENSRWPHWRQLRRSRQASPAEFVEYLSGTLKIGTAIAAVSEKFQTAKLRRGFQTLPDAAERGPAILQPDPQLTSRISWPSATDWANLDGSSEPVPIWPLNTGNTEGGRRISGADHLRA